MFNQPTLFRRRRCVPSSADCYRLLEDRRLLAAMFYGTPGDDLARIDYVDDTTVNVTINDTLHENVSSADGIRINLGNGIRDRVVMQDRVDLLLSIANAEIIELDGDGANRFEVSFKPTEVQPPGGSLLAGDAVPGHVVGRINEHVTFVGAATLKGGQGNDSFTVRTDYAYALGVYGEAGDDTIRFSEWSDPGPPILYSRSDDPAPSTKVISADPISTEFISAFRPFVSQTRGFGGAGNDRLVFLNRTRATGQGGDGFDTLDYSQMNGNAHVRIGNTGNERVIGQPGQINSVWMSGTDTFRHSQWHVRGAFADVRNIADDSRIELYHFQRYQGSADARSYDRLWVTETSADLQIGNFDWVQISSSRQAIEGKLDTISHDIEFRRVDDHYGLALVPYPDYRPMTVLISDAAGDGFNATLDGNQISGLTGGRISFGWDQGIDLTVHGSTVEADHVTINNTMVDTTFYTHGGDDTFAIGGTTEGDLTGIQHELYLGVGVGDDQITLHDQRSTLADLRYQLDENGLRDRDAGVRHAPIRFNGAVERVRLNGSSQGANHFHVTPSRAVEFQIEGVDTNLLDRLYIEGLDPDTGLLDEVAGDGVWSFPGTRPVLFRNIEDPRA